MISPLDYPALCSVLGERVEVESNDGPREYVDEFLDPPKSNLPDYRGFFLRGQGGNSADLGVPQDSALARHRHHLFRNDKLDESFHEEPTPETSFSSVRLHPSNADYAYAMMGKVESDKNWLGTSSYTGAADETRPINKAVHWLIRAK